MANEQLKRRALHRAFYIAGNGDALARALRLPPPELARLLGGKKEIPNGVFLDCVDFILDHPGEGRRASGSPDLETRQAVS